MSSLCKYSFITINKNDSSPTPTLRKTLNPCNDLLPVKFLQTANFIKRISLLILPRTPVKASMTVETALVLPLFCFFMIHMGSAIEMMRLHGNLEVALWDADTVKRKDTVYLCQIPMWLRQSFACFVRQGRSVECGETSFCPLY